MIRADEETLRDALESLLMRGPSSYTGRNDGENECWWCQAVEGTIHDDNCPWLRARLLLDGDDCMSDVKVGEEDEITQDPLIPSPFHE